MKALQIQTEVFALYCFIETVKRRPTVFQASERMLGEWVDCTCYEKTEAQNPHGGRGELLTSDLHTNCEACVRPHKDKMNTLIKKVLNKV